MNKIELIDKFIDSHSLVEEKDLGKTLQVRSGDLKTLMIDALDEFEFEVSDIRLELETNGDLDVSDIPTVIDALKWYRKEISK